MNLRSLIPILRVKDARDSETFYCQLLGFSKDWEHQFEPGFPLMLALSNAQQTLFLSEHRGTGTDNCDLYFYVADVDAFYVTAQAKGLLFEQPPISQSWGVREVVFRDPDNHRFTVGTVTASAV